MLDCLDNIQSHIFLDLSNSLCLGDIQSDRFLQPPAIEVTGMCKTERPSNTER